ncbi:hypothetical protein LEN26_018999 [Aphanomyces euteiches]|nr:hypothetical protein LEN26_018999 [Aphanomyces euteiches]KAH9129778.1 hypothetical protein AeMF1_000198 [Aphanomyces euteiches]KAH9183172.1 hypothetical protein AeNC1_014854 [Aphanomyces euteiches]
MHALRRPKWTLHEEHEINEIASASLRQFILDAQLINSEGEIEWSLDGTAKDCHVQVFSGKARGNVAVYAGSMQIPGSLDEAATICEQFPSYHNFDPLETLTLADIETDMPYHHVGIEWMSLKASGVIQNRDACLLEVRDMFTTHDGVRGFASLTQSIDIPECPPMDASHGLIRVSVRHTGYMFTEIEPGLLDVVYSVHIDFRGTIPGWLSRRYMKKRAAQVAALDSCFRQLQAMSSKRSFVGSTLSNSHCACCSKSFGTFEFKKQCSVCLDRVCKLCFTTGLVPHQNKVMALCIRCVLTEAPRPVTPRPGRTPKTPATMSTGRKHTSSLPTSSRLTRIPSNAPLSSSHSHSYASNRSSSHKSAYAPQPATATEYWRSKSAIQLTDDLRSSSEDERVDEFLDVGYNLVRPDLLEKFADDGADSFRTTSTTMESMRESTAIMSLSDDDCSSVVSVASTGVWKDAISNFHSNLSKFREGMRQGPPSPQRQLPMFS